MNSLIGLKYPVKDADTGEVAGYKIIKNVTHLGNVTGSVVYLGDSTEHGIFVSFPEEQALIENQASFENLKNWSK